MDYALKSLKMRADNGDTDAMVKLANRFKSGNGVRRNLKKALKYLDRAASLKNADAFVELGKLYLEKDDVFTAEEEWTKADGLGSVEAAYLIGRLYRKSGEIPRNTDKAEFWYNRAAQKGYALAIYELGDLYLYDGRYEEGFELIKQAASLGVAEAKNTVDNINACIESGIKDYKFAASFNAAVKAGITTAKGLRDAQKAQEMPKKITRVEL